MQDFGKNAFVDAKPVDANDLIAGAQTALVRLVTIVIIITLILRKMKMFTGQVFGL